MERRPSSAIIIGGGIGGLSLACGLAQHDWDVLVVEIGDENANGFGLGFPAYAFDALAPLGLQSALLDIGFSNHQVNLCDADGQLVRVKIHKQLPGRVGPVELMLGRPKLIKTLQAEATARGARIAFNTTFNEIEDQGDVVQVTLTDGTTHSVDLVVGADGLNSAVRRTYLAPDLTPDVTEGGFFRALMPEVDELSEAYAFEGDEGLVYTYPVGSGMVYAGVFVGHSLGSLRTDATRTEFLRILSRYSSPQITALTEFIRRPDVPVSYRDVQKLLVEHPVSGRIALIGDAAHTMPPNLGGGGSMSVEDASVMTRMVGDLAASELPQKLQEYATRRLPRVTRVVNDSWAVIRNGPSLDNWGGTTDLKDSHVAWINTPA